MLSISLSPPCFPNVPSFFFYNLLSLYCDYMFLRVSFLISWELCEGRDYMFVFRTIWFTGLAESDDYEGKEWMIFHRTSKTNLDHFILVPPYFTIFPKAILFPRNGFYACIFVKLTDNLASILHCKALKMRNRLWNSCLRHFHSLATISPQWWPLNLAWA